MKKTLIVLGIALCALVVASPQGVPVHTNSVVGVTSTEYLAANKNRGYIIIQNNGAGNCQIKFGSAISSDNDGVVIGPSQNYEAVNAYIKSSVYAKCTVSSSLAAIESNY